MSVNPLAGIGSPTNLAALVANELAALAADAQTLASRLSAGDLVRATVLPSNGLTDLLEIDGLRVAAELPPTVVPGETLTVEVTGFSGDRINLHIVPDGGTVEPVPPSAGAALGNSPLGVRASAGAAKDVSADPADGPGQRIGAKPAGGSASAQGATRAGPAASRSTNIDVARLAAVAKERYASRPSEAAAPTPRVDRLPPPGLKSIEARIATARATAAPPAAPPSLAERPKPVVSPVLLRPLISPRSPAPAAAAANVDASGVADQPRSTTARGAEAPTGVPRNPAAYTQPAALLRALYLPVTPSNVNAARLALEAPHALSQALDTLERALTATADPHVATLRTLTAFLARIDPQSPVLATQVASFVDQVVVGREPKLALLLGDLEQATAQPRSDDLPAVERGAGFRTVVAERVALREAGLAYDLKTNVLALAQTSGSSPAASALTGALAAITGLQAAAATLLAAQPDGLSFVLPVALPDGFAQAQVRIDRDAPRAPGVPLDGDNFHIAFVLDTHHLGTVAIDVVTVGRSVTVGVQTEAQLAARAFGSALETLKARLGALRYTVAKAEATVAPRGAPGASSSPADAPPPPKPLDPPHAIDVDA